MGGARAALGVALGVALHVGPAAAQAVDQAVPLGVASPLATVVVVDPIAYPGIVGDSAMGLLIARCRRVMPVSSADSARLVQRAPRDVERSYRAGAPWYVSFFVAPVQHGQAACADPESQYLIAPTRGVSFTANGEVGTGPSPTQAVLMRGERRIEAADVATGTTVRLGHDGLAPELDGLVRLSIPIDSLAPDAEGVATDVWLAVSFAGDTAPRRIPVPAAVLTQLWERVLMQRLGEYEVRPIDEEIVALLPRPPRDRRLQLAFRSYAQGDFTRAAANATRRIRDTVVTSADRVSVRVQVATTALALGDTASARIQFQEALEAEPCLDLAGGALGGARDVFDGLRRPPGMCTTSPLWRIGLRGLLLPGFGRAYTTPRRAAGVGVIAAIGATFLMSARTATDADALYASYLTYVPPGLPFGVREQRAKQAYRKAELKRVHSALWMNAGFALWILSAAEAVMQEGQHHAHLNEVQNYGVVRGRETGAAPRVTPVLGDGRFGLAIAFFE